MVYFGTGNPKETDVVERLENYGPVSLHKTSSRKATLEQLSTLLRHAKMGTRLYAVGGESFLGLVMREAIEHGMHHDSVITELRGSLARRVQCVHCKCIAEDIIATIYDCRVVTKPCSFATTTHVVLRRFRASRPR